MIELYYIYFWHHPDCLVLAHTLSEQVLSRNFEPDAVVTNQAANRSDAAIPYLTTRGRRCMARFSSFLLRRLSASLRLSHSRSRSVSSHLRWTLLTFIA